MGNLENIEHLLRKGLTTQKIREDFEDMISHETDTFLRDWQRLDDDLKQIAATYESLERTYENQKRDISRGLREPAIEKVKTSTISKKKLAAMPISVSIQTQKRHTNPQTTYLKPAAISTLSNHSAALQPELAFQLSQESIANMFMNFYDELVRIARVSLKGTRPSSDLDPVDLINEVYIRLMSDNKESHWENRKHFFSLIARIMRQIIIDEARRRKRWRQEGLSKDGELRREVALLLEADTLNNLDEVVTLSEALTALEKSDLRAKEVVELRYFVGLTIKEIAEVLELSLATVKRKWLFGKTCIPTHNRSRLMAPRK